MGTLAAANAAGAPRAHYDVDYRVEFVPREGVAAVTIATTPRDGARVTRLRLRMRASRYSQVAGDGRIAREGDRVTWEPPESGGMLRYRYEIDHRRHNGGYDAVIGPHWVIVRGDDLVPVGSVTATEGAESRARLRFALPKGWTNVDTPYRRARNGSDFVVVDAKRRFDRPVGWIIAGEVGTRRETIAGCEFSAAGPKGEPVRRNDMIAFANIALPHLQRAAGGLPPKLLVVSAGDPMWRGGLSGPRSLFLHASRPLFSENGTSSLMHELFHAVTRIRGARGADWIAEGLAEYYSIELPRRAGLLGATRYEKALAWMERFSRGVSRLRARRADARITARAVLLLRELDREIGANSGGEANLDDVVRALIPIREVELSDLRAAAERAGGAPSKVLESALLAEPTRDPKDDSMRLPDDETLVLLHNPRCSKSRAAHALLTERGVPFEERRYLEDPLDRAELASLRERLGRPAAEWVRSGEPAFAGAGLDASSSEEQILDAIAAHPILLERPILVRGARAVVGRPLENVLALL